MNRRYFLLGLGACALTPLTGCKPKAPYALVPIKGVATYNGQPLPEGFSIQFEPEDGSRPSFGKIGPGGSFEAIHTATQKGVKTGKNVVKVYWNEPPELNPVPEEYKNLMAKYGFTGSETMTVDIQKKDSNFTVDFKD